MAEDGKIVPLSDVKKMLEKEEKVRELSYEQRLALEHSKQFVGIDPKKTSKTIKELMKIERVNDSLAAKIVELFPRSENEVRAIFAKERFNLEPDDIQKIIKILSEAG
jgi:DNA-directed RNA polymerase subunit F